MAIPKVSSLSNDPAALALQALAWALADERRAQQVGSQAGQVEEALRQRIGSAEVQLSVLEFLCAHEPDLVAAAEALGVAPGEIAGARERLAS